MKKSATLLLALLCLFFSSLAQPCNNRPTNGTIFDWTAQNFTIYTLSHGTVSVASPFYTFSLNNPNTYQFSAYTAKDFLASDGWTFIKKDFGSPTSATDFPYLILYNKYSGTLRVFYAFGQLYGQNDAISMTLTYNNHSYRSAIFDNYAGIGNSVQDFANNISPITVNNFYNNSILYWYHSDFTLSYDPCVCKYNESLLFTVKLSSTANLQFTVEGTAIQQIDNYGRSGNDGGPNVFGSLAGVFRNGATAASGIGSNLSGLTKWNSLSTSQKNFFNNLGNNLSGFGNIFGAASFLFGLFDGNTAGAPPRPLAFDINLRATGTISYSNPYGYLILPVSGENNANLDANTLPYYDNALGVFNLLTTPVTYEKGAHVYDGGDDGGFGNGAFWEEYSWYNLSVPSDIKYIINPNAGLTTNPQYIQIWASYVYKYNDEDEQETNSYPIGCFKDLKLYLWEAQYQSDNQAANYRHQLEYIYIRVSAKIKTADLSKDVSFTRMYKLQRNGVILGDYDAFDTYPSSSCTTVSPPATDQEISAVCNSSTYTGRASAYLRTEQVPRNLLRNPTAINKNSLVVTPNPMINGMGKVTVILKDEGAMKLYLMDVGGRKVKDIVDGTGFGKGIYSYDLKLDGLSKGIYVAVLVTKSGQLSEKVIVQ